MSENRQRSILVFGAHPDDIEFGCGAVLLKEAGEGARIHFVICSRGESGTNGSPEQREVECRTAAELVGASIEFLDCGGDSRIESTRAIAMMFAGVIREQKPDLLLAPSLVENQHPDHCSVGRAVRDGARLARYAGIEELKTKEAHAIESLFYYAITPGAEPVGETALVIDVSEQIDSWRGVMACHASQMKTRRYLELQVSRSRTLGLQAGVEYAQALWAGDALFLDSLNSVPRGIRLF
ncbi:PIG-L deacetylase family protein [Pelagicoccus mobilis]|uniref:PIG-L family deacetylase n=1 Tax=Pelagicoccus mobilis TaxID=415221 RepID=A0A934VU75_9BACT|nr:PIG-L family deacetylase [Pelagicoccus mobilis]MBK1880264.1 PIG-L family deacetylase [Pelagicoccus mobilis]